MISNSIKYKKSAEASPYIRFVTELDKTKGEIKLTIRDNGIGVKPFTLYL